MKGGWCNKADKSNQKKDNIDLLQELNNLEKNIGKWKIYSLYTLVSSVSSSSSIIEASSAGIVFDIVGGIGSGIGGGFGGGDFGGGGFDASW